MKRFLVLFVLLSVTALAACKPSVVPSPTPDATLSATPIAVPSATTSDLPDTTLPQSAGATPGGLASPTPAKSPSLTPVAPGLTPTPDFVASASPTIDPAPTATPTAPPTEPPVFPSSSPMTYPDLSDLTFADLSRMSFGLSRGHGAWFAEIDLASDGSFCGYFYDANMGETGPGYSDGTRYYCAFDGEFTSLRKVGNYEYSMICQSMEQEGTPGETVIDEDIRYITATPPGFRNGVEFILYLPGKRVSELPDAFKQWVGLDSAWGVDFDNMEVYPYFGLYQVEDKFGFY